MSEKKVNYTKHFIFTGLIFVLGPSLGFSQKYLEPIILGMPRALEKAAARSVTQKALSVTLPALTEEFLVEAGLPSLHFDDLNVNYLYGPKPSIPNRVAFEPLVFPPAVTDAVGKNKVPLSPAAALQEERFTRLFNTTLSVEQFPVNGPLDKDFTALTVSNHAGQIDIVASLRKEFYSSLRSDLFHPLREDFPYDRYVPSQNLDVIYLGVAHYGHVENNIVNWVRAIKRKYPTRHIYFATEYVWDTSIPRTAEDIAPIKILRNKQQLLLQLEEADYHRYSFLQSVIDEGVPVVGIEPTTTMLAEAYKEAGVHLFDELIILRLNNLATSEVGLVKRNQIWAEHIRQIRAQDPDALVIVCGGAQHVAYSSSYSVPQLLKELKGFVIVQLHRLGKEALNPVLSQLEDRTYQQFVREAARSADRTDAHYVLTFKSPTEEGPRTSENLTSFKRAVGADVVVVVP